MRRWIPRLVLATCSSLLLAPAVHAQYTVTDLGSLGGPISIARAINTGGIVAGYALVDATTYHAFRWDGSIHDLGTLGGTSSYAYGLNAAGTIVGSAADTSAGSPQRAFRYDAGVMRDLGDLGGPTGTAYGINDLDQIVGSSDTNPTFGNAHGFLWKNGAMTDLNTLGGQFSVAFGLNNTSRVVGTAYMTGNTANHAVRWFAGGIADLGTLGGTRSVATAINFPGTIVGYSNYTGGGAHDRAFVRPGGGPTNTGLGSLGGSDSQAWAINDAGLIVGWSTLVGDTVRHAFFSNGSGMTDLNTLLPGGSGWVLNEAYGVNRPGQVVGVGKHNGNTRAFLLSPATLVAVESGAGGIAFAGSSPNPAPGGATFAYALAEPGHVRLALFDVSGRLARTLEEGDRPAGQNVVAWDGRDANGSPVGAGLYFARLECAGRALTRRVSVVR